MCSMEFISELELHFPPDPVLIILWTYPPDPVLLMSELELQGADGEIYLWTRITFSLRVLTILILLSLNLAYEVSVSFENTEEILFFTSIIRIS